MIATADEPASIELLMRAPEAVRAAADVLRVPVPMSPSSFAELHRSLKPGTTFRDGPWDNSVFPYLVGIMDAIAEAIETGRRGVILLKSAQGGGSEAMINALCWLRVYHPGPFLYLISKEGHAEEFARDRFDWVNKTCEPVKAKANLGYGSGSSLLIKRYTDGKLVIAGGRSILNLESFPYRVVFVDEADSLQDEFQGKGDPFAMAEARTDAFPGRTLIVAFAHPSTVERGVGKLYYTLSDQRRGFVRCPACSSSFRLRWDDVAAEPDGRALEVVRRDPASYRYRTPCCRHNLTDGERFAACRSIEHRSTLSPERARSMPFIGVHFSQLYMDNKPLSVLAERFVRGLEDPATARVFVNKQMGDVYQAPALEHEGPDAWRALIVTRSTHVLDSPYLRGEVPPGVTFLTAGQDSRASELHWTVWGWGLVPDAGAAGAPRVLCGWLIDYGVIARTPPSLVLEAADLEPLDQVLYLRRFRSPDGTRQIAVTIGMHDSGWQPVGVYEWCRTREHARACPVKGGSHDEFSQAELLSWSTPPAYEIRGVVIEARKVRFARVNTYQAKLALLGLVPRRFEGTDERTGATRPNATRLRLPVDVGDDFIAHAASERLVLGSRGQRTWVASGPNHWSDCNVYSYVAARNVYDLQGGMTAREIENEQRARSQPRRPAPAQRTIRRRY